MLYYWLQTCNFTGKWIPIWWLFQAIFWNFGDSYFNKYFKDHSTGLLQRANSSNLSLILTVSFVRLFDSLHLELFYQFLKIILIKFSGQIISNEHQKWCFCSFINFLSILIILIMVMMTIARLPTKHKKIFSNQAGSYMLKVRNTRARCEIYLKLTIKTPERHDLRSSGALLLTLNIFHTLFYSFYC